MKRSVLLILIIFLSIESFAQREDLRKEILDYTDSTAEMITKGRSLLAEKFTEGDYNKVKEIRNYLKNNIRDTNYIIFYPIENWYLLYWTREYDQLLESILTAVPVSFRTRKIRPADDFLFDKLLKISRDSIEILEESIQLSNLRAIDKDFLLLTLRFLTSDENGGEAVVDNLNELADKFLAIYPGSIYEPFIRNSIRYQIIPSNWAFTFEFYSGYGIITGGLQDIFANPVPLGIAFDIYYKNWVLYLRGHAGLSRTKKDISYNNGIWKKKSQANIYVPEASIGYVLVDNKTFKLAPFVGIGGTSISPTDNDLDKDPGLKNAEWKMTTTYFAGISTDIKLGQSKMMMINPREQSYWFLRLRYTYNYTRFEKKFGISGNTHNITVGLGGFGRRLKRDY